MDTFSNEVARAAKKARAVFEEELCGDKGILMTLREEHDRLKWTLNGIANTGDRDRRIELYGRLRVALLAHTEAEETTVYLKLSQSGEGELMTKSAQEHQAALDLIRALDALSYDDPQWMQTFQQLANDVERHIEHEEKTVFRLARAQFRSEELSQLDKEFRQARLYAIQSLA